MKQIPKENLPGLLDAVLTAAGKGEQIVVTENKRPLALISGFDGDLARDLQFHKTLTEKLIRDVLPLGLSLAAEKDLTRLLERILYESQDLCHADGGTLYLRGRNHELKFIALRTKSLKLAAGGTTGNPIALPPLKILEDGSGKPNLKFASTWVCIQGKTLNIPDVYHSEEFDFSGARKFDQANQYQTQSCLTVPLKDNGGNVLGVIQLINATDPASGNRISFNPYVVQIVEILAVLASVTLQNHLEKLKV